MKFEKFKAEQYRKLDQKQFEERKAQVIDLLADPECEVELEVLRAEKDMIVAEAARRNAEMELRSAKINKVTSGEGVVVERTSIHEQKKEMEPVDVYGTDEYKRAFYDFVTRGAKLPQQFQLRSDAFTATSDTKAVIPTTLMNRIIEKMDTYGEIFARVTKTNIKGGVEYPIIDLKPEAHWVGETQADTKQKLTANDKVSFSYYELACTLSQTRLASLVTMNEFEAKFPEYAAEAMVKALEKAIISGTGTGQPLGITKDARIKNVVELTEADLSSWEAWHKKVKAKMPKAYRDGQFIMAQGSFDGFIDGMVDANGQPVGRTNYGINGEEAYRFIGKDVLTVEPTLLPDFSDAAAGDVIAIFGRLGDYVINSNKQLEMNRWIDYDNRRENLGAYLVCDGKVLDPNGFMIIKKKAATGK